MQIDEKNYFDLGGDRRIFYSVLHSFFIKVEMEWEEIRRRENKKIKFLHFV